MTKRVRIENADTANYKVIVEVWEKAASFPQDGAEAKDTLVSVIKLDYPTAMTGDDCYLTSSRYLIVKEA